MGKRWETGGQQRGVQSIKACAEVKTGVQCSAAVCSEEMNSTPCAQTGVIRTDSDWAVGETWTGRPARTRHGAITYDFRNILHQTPFQTVHCTVYQSKLSQWARL